MLIAIRKFFLVVAFVSLASAPADSVALGEDILPPGKLPLGPLSVPKAAEVEPGGWLVKLTPAGKTRMMQQAKKRKGVVVPAKRMLTTEVARTMGLRVGEFLFGNSFAVKGRGDSTVRVNREIKKGNVARVELNYRVYAFQRQVAVASEPNDFLYSLGFQWGMNNAGKSNVDVDAPEAWEVSTGDPDLVVGVIDTGITLDHPDLVRNIWINPLETENGKDDDRNGYVDDVNGYDFIDDDNDPTDDMFHGTHVAGAIAAECNNRRGVCGVAPTVKLLSLKILNAKGEGDMAGLLKALQYAIDLKRAGINIRVLNASLGGGDRLESFQELLDDAAREGIVFVAAAGNESNDNDVTPTYPANYDGNALISVAALDRNGKLASFSNFGTKQVDVAAPGVSIWSTFPYGFYLPFDGTSMAAPYVSGVAALVASLHPNSSAEDIAARVKASVKPIPGMAGKMSSPGIVSAAIAVGK